MSVPYTETATYRTRLAKLEADVQSLTTIITEISCIRLRGGSVNRKRTPEEERKLLNAKNRLKTAKKRLLEWTTLSSITPWDIIHLIQAADGTLWNEKQYELWHKELQSHEGRGEASDRDFRGLPPAESTTEEIDIPELEIEVKNVQGRAKNGTLQLQTIQAGKAGRQAYSMWMGRSAELGHFKDLSDEVRQALFTGEVPRNVIYGHLPATVKESLLATIRPSSVFARPMTIDCTTRNGMLSIPASEFDAAWDIVCVTKCGPKYTLKKGYLLERLKKTLAAKDASDVVAQ